MEYLGMLCLGLFVGGFVCRGLNFVDNADKFRSIVTFVLASAFTSPVFGFAQYWINKEGTSDAANVSVLSLAMYPPGLLIAMLWYYCEVAVTNIRSPQRMNNVPVPTPAARGRRPAALAGSRPTRARFETHHEPPTHGSPCRAPGAILPQFRVLAQISCENLRPHRQVSHGATSV
jgi:hypothetical protein